MPRIARTPTREEIYRKALELWMQRYGAKIGVYTTPTEEELKELNLWQEAQIMLMTGELSRLESMAREAALTGNEQLLDMISADFEELRSRIEELLEETRRLQQELVRQKAEAETRMPRTLYETLRDMQVEGIIYRFTVYENRVVIDLHPRFIDTVKQRLFRHGVRDVDVRTVRRTLARISFNLPVEEYPTIEDVRAKISELETQVATLATEEKITPEEEMTLYQRLSRIRRQLERGEISPRQALDELEGIETIIERYKTRPPRKPEVEKPPTPPAYAPPPTPMLPMEEISRMFREMIREETKRLTTKLTRELGARLALSPKMALPESVELVIRFDSKGRPVLALDDYAEGVLYDALGTAQAKGDVYIKDAWYIFGKEDVLPADVYILMYGMSLKPWRWWQWFADVIKYVREHYDELAKIVAMGRKVVFVYPNKTPRIE